MVRRGERAERSGFGLRLRHFREQAGLTQVQLAERAGCHYMALQYLETCRSEPSWPMVLSLADALGVGLEEFRLPTGEKPPVEAVVSKRGRPRKEPAAQTPVPKPRKRPRGRPRLQA